MPPLEPPNKLLIPLVTLDSMPPLEPPNKLLIPLVTLDSMLPSPPNKPVTLETRLSRIPPPPVLPLVTLAASQAEVITCCPRLAICCSAYCKLVARDTAPSATVLVAVAIVAELSLLLLA